MKIITFLKVLVLLSVVLFLFTNSAIACTCIRYDTVNEAYSKADAVIIGKVKKISNDGIALTNEITLSGQNVTLGVVKSFKKIKQAEINILQPNTSCDWEFKTQDINETYLFYLRYDEKSKRYKVIECGRSAEIGKANDDLSWLNKLPQSLNKTRISGVIGLYEKGYEVKLIKNLVGIKVKIYSKNKSYTVFTDKKGLYEVWNLPTGKYNVEPSFPKNYSIYLKMEGGSLDYEDVPDSNVKYSSFKAIIGKGKDCCAVFDYLVNQD